MPLELAIWLVRGFYLYAAVGALLLPWWHLRGLRKLDTAAGTGPWGFRVLISPGLIALWPWMVTRARGGKGHPAPEKTAHREIAQKPLP